MDALTEIRTVLRHPSVLRSYQSIMLLSHMRANTSLLGHIIGSSPEVEGYYELHIGYYSWKSLVRQKLLHFAQHSPKRAARFMFDKVLHDDHYVNLSLFDKGKVIFALRPPERTIPSIVSLYRSVEPDHPHTDSGNAARYYVERIQSLAAIAQNSPVNFLYLDADAVREDTSHTLEAISNFIGLRQPLQDHYQQQNLTGAKKMGDSSGPIASGKIERVTRNYADIEVPGDVMANAREQFQSARAQICGSPRCITRVLLHDES